MDAGRTFSGRDEIRDFGLSLIEDQSKYTIVDLVGTDTRAQLTFDYTAGEDGWYTLDNAHGELVAKNGLIRSLILD